MCRICLSACLYLATSRYLYHVMYYMIVLASNYSTAVPVAEFSQPVRDACRFHEGRLQQPHLVAYAGGRLLKAARGSALHALPVPDPREDGLLSHQHQ
eukprot:COSAG01_NODE_2477_length_7615_cov_7.259609_3_plen_98_part_00